MTQVVINPARAHLTKAKILARSWMPYMSHILTSMRTYVGPHIPTMAVDQFSRLYVNPDWIQTLSVRQVAYVLLHEVLHVVLSHARRRRQFLPGVTKQQANVWNIAADLCIQQMLARHHRADEPEDGMKIEGELEPGVPFLSIPGLNRGMTTEAYYQVLWDFLNQRPKEPGGSGGQEQEQGQQDGDEQDQGDSEQEQQPGGQSDKPLDPRNAGSGSDGLPRDYEPPSKLADEAMMEGKLRELERRMEEAESAKPGSVPGELRKSVEARLHPQPDPFDQLRGIVAKSVASPLGAEEHTYRRLHRRQADNTARMRGVVRMTPECSVIVDTSGSMSCGNIRDKAMTAVAQGLRKVQRPRVVCFDTQVQDARRLTSMKDFQWVGDGGTDMAAAIEQEDKEHRPDAIVLITDGETGWPSQKTRARLIVALCKDPGCYGDPIPSWARVVRCYEEGPKHGG
jgi:predicted metal-dependent peptidase